MLLQRTQTLSEERGQQLRDQCPPVGGYPQRHGHDASQADHQGREAQEKGKNFPLPRCKSGNCGDVLNCTL